jgi:GntR family transcriptional repressor for pyruvate dehydrogenase complex
MDILSNISPVVVEKPSDLIIRQIKELITSGVLKPGDKLPSERKLSESFGVGRTSVRDAVKKLEFFGILKTLPQSGTIVAGHEIQMLENLIGDVLRMEHFDFYSLAEVRVLLEMKAANLCAKRRSEEDLVCLKAAIEEYEQKVLEKTATFKDDFKIHQKIAKGSGNQVLESLLLIITPDLMTYYHTHDFCKRDYERPLKEHWELYHYIEAQDASKAALLMKKHLKNLLEFAKERKLRTK